MSDSVTIYDGTNVGKRVCGTCQLCCKLLPVKTLRKEGWTKCKYQRVGKGCLIYNAPAMPPECSLWSCRWLTGQDTADQLRPDRSHFVIDLMPDMLTVVQDGKQIEAMVFQIWADPAFPGVLHDPSLRDWVERHAETDRMATIVRMGTYRAVLLVAPCLAAGGEWLDREVTCTNPPAGSGNRLVDRLAEQRSGDLAAGRDDHTSPDSSTTHGA